jgi:diketogulonate reductase-like aldo/keto reductase
MDSTVELNNGVGMPILGLGVYKSQPGEETEHAVSHALKVGYRHIDTAKLYANERDVGLALLKSGIQREEVFITTKLWNSDHGYDATLRAFESSLERLGLEYLDLYLLHWPVEELRQDSWRAMETILAGGSCRAVGVSNYTIRHLEELLGTSKVVPAVNQVEFTPFLYQSKLLRYCREQNIQLEAYSPLTRGRKFNHPILIEIAANYDRSVPQILIRWAIEHEVVVIPKSATRARIEENSSVFDFSISDSDMAALDALNEDLHLCWNPTNVP